MAYIPQDLGSYDELEGMGKFKLKIKLPKIKIPKGIAKAVEGVVKVATAPITTVAAVSAQAVGLKSVAADLNKNQMILSNEALKAAGTAVQAAGVAVGAVVAAPVVASAVSSVAGAAGGALKVVAAKGLTSLLGRQVPPPSPEATDATGAPLDAQAFYDRGVVDAKAGSSKALVDPAGQQYYDMGYADQRSLMAQVQAAPEVPPAMPVQAPAVPREVTQAQPLVFRPMTPPIDVPASVASSAQPSGEDDTYKYSLMSEEQLRAELEQVERAIRYRQEQGLSLTDRFTDLTLVQLARRRAALLAALAPYLAKKYWMYGAGLGAALLVALLAKRSK